MHEEKNLALTNAVDKQPMQWTNTGILRLSSGKLDIRPTGVRAQLFTT